MSHSEYRFSSILVMGSLMLLILGVAFPENLAAAIYKWKDENGKVHFTDNRSKIPLKYRKQKPHFAPTPASKKPKIPSARKDFQPEGSAQVEGISARDRRGKKTSITADSETAVFAVATWCSYSQRFINYLNDPNISGKMDGINLVFLFNDEWPHIKKNLDKSVKKGKLTPAQASEQLKYLKKKAKGKMVYDPSFMKGLPSEYYFAPDLDGDWKDIFPKAFPVAFSPSNDNFDHSIAQWIRSQFEDEEATQDFLVAEYLKYNKGEK